MSKLVETKDWRVDRKKGGRALRELRLQRGVTQDELAESSGVPKTLISRLESGGTEKPSLEMAISLWGALGLTPTRAAQDYGVFRSSTHIVDDPRAEEYRAIIHTLSDEPELQSKLLDAMLMTARVFLATHKERANETSFAKP